jgi:beta-lactamase class A
MLAGAAAVAAVAAVPLLAGPAMAATPTPGLTSPVPSDPTPPETDWIAWLAQRRDHVSLYADDGRGRRLALRPNRQVAMASAYKAIHAATFAGSGINPQRQIRVRDWEAHYLPAYDSGAHPRALARLGIPVNGYYAADPDQLVPLDSLVHVMIVESDNAAADYLHDLLGVPALRRTAACGGWPDAEMATELGDMLRLWWPGTSDELSRRFLTDEAFKNTALAKLSQPPSTDAALAWTNTTHRGSAVELASLHRAISIQRIPGRRYLEQDYTGALRPGELGLGLKGGSLPGVVTVGLSLRRVDGTVGTVALLVDNLSLAEGQSISADVDDYLLQGPLGMLRDPAAWQRIAREVVHA